MACASALNSSNNLRRVIVGFKQSKSRNSVILPKFIECIVKYFSPDELSTKVGCYLQDNLLILYPPSELEQKSQSINGELPLFYNTSDFGSVLLQHSPECPMYKLCNSAQLNKSLQEKTINQGIYVGVAIILESSDSRVLLTQRAKHMRSFPKTWVPPGGHLEHGETILQAGLRELSEETGLKLEPTEFRILCLWESVYPVLLTMGAPRNHHVVLYLHVKSCESHLQLLDKMTLDPEEVQACTWLSDSNIQALMCDEQEELPPFKQWTLLPGPVQIVAKELQVKTMFDYSWNCDIYTGTQLALLHWLKLRQKNDSENSKL